MGLLCKLCTTYRTYYSVDILDISLIYYMVYRFVDHVTILFLLLRTWESIIIDVIINLLHVRSTIGYLSNSWAWLLVVHCQLSAPTPQLMNHGYFWHCASSFHCHS